MDTLINQGNTLIVMAPDGIRYTLREQNGNDEDVISKISNSKDNTAASKFLAGIIVEPKLSWQKVHKLPINVKYYLMVESRIFNFGPEFEFEHQFDNGDTFTFTEDLSKYQIDYSNFEEAIKHVEDSSIIVPPYPDPSEYQEIKLGNKELRYKLLTSEGEAMSVSKGKDNISQNDVFRFRELSVKDPTKKSGWTPVDNFRVFSSREMRELRRHVKLHDPSYNMTITLKHPTKTDVKPEIMPLIAYNEFFFPD